MDFVNTLNTFILLLFGVCLLTFLHYKGVSESSGTVRVEGGAAGFSMYGLQLCSYGKQMVTWGNSLEAVGRKGREMNKERE